MKIAVLGTGMVARTLGEKLDSLGHEVALGTRDVEVTTARTGDGESFADWARAHNSIALRTFADAVRDADLVINATNGAASVDAVRAAGSGGLDGKVLIDVANPLDFSQGFPPTLFVADRDSLAEQIQREVPGARVVKTLNTVNADVMVDPASLGDDSAILVSGDDADAKLVAVSVLREFGWKQVIDLGDLNTARGPEMYLGLWVRMMGALGTSAFNIKIVR